MAAMDKAVKGVCDILRRDKAKGARLCVPEVTWMWVSPSAQPQQTCFKSDGLVKQPSFLLIWPNGSVNILGYNGGAFR